MKHHRLLQPAFLLIIALGLVQQGSATTPDADLIFDDSLFAEPFPFDEQEDADSWLDGFTIKISQQFFGQVNHHGVTLEPGLSFEREPELENSRLGINVRYQNPFAPGWLLQASAQSRFYWPGDYEYEAAGDKLDTEFRGNELFVQRSFGQHSIKFGRQTVVWGETVGNSVLDVINTSEFRDLTIIDIEDARLNQWLLVWDYFATNADSSNSFSSSFSTFINLYPDFNPTPVRGSPFFFEVPHNLVDYRRGGELLFEAGSQWRRSVAGSDIAVMAAYLYENQLRYDAPRSGGSGGGDGGDESGAGDAVPVKNDYLLLGFSANRALGRVLLNLDLAFSHGVLDNRLDFSGSSFSSNSPNNNPVNTSNNNPPSPLRQKKDRIGASFGFEWAIDNEQNMSLGIQAQKVLDERGGLASDQMLVNEGVYGGWLVRYSNSLRNGDLLLSSTLQGNLETDYVLMLLGMDYTLDDNWSISGQIITIHANSDSQLLFLDEDVRFGATLTYAF
ncbi:MAG: hypothetical protein ACR2PR_12730 [Pseudohongiellaceae bacterium]